MTRAFACALIEKQFPELAPVNAQYLGAGWDNTVFLVNHTWVFRFPRRQSAVPLFTQETLTLKGLRDFPLNYPQPVFYGQADTVKGEHFPWPFMGYTWVKGQSACQAQVLPAHRQHWATALGQALRYLHHHPIPKALIGDTLQRADLSYRLPWFQDQLALARQSAHNQQHQLPERAITRLLAALSHDTSLPQVKPVPALLHGDLYIRHLTVNPAGHLTGLIDWGDTHQGDISTDLAIVYSAIPPHFHDIFWQNYGEVSEQTQRKAQFRALYSCLYIYRYGLGIQDPDLVREGWQGLQWIASFYP